MTTPSTNSAATLKAQQARQDRLDELYDQDGRHEPSHPLHGLYTRLVQHKTTTEVSMSEFVFLFLKAKKIAIRKASIHAFYMSASGETVIEYTSEAAIVKESFDEVCSRLGVAVPQQEQS